MKQSKRQAQVGEIIRRNFSIVLMEEGRYIYGEEPLVTVTHVLMSPDLGIAKIYLSVYNVQNKITVIDMLSAQGTKLRQALGARIRKHVRRIPYVDFYLDETLDEIERVDKLFENLDSDAGQSNEEE